MEHINSSFTRKLDGVQCLRAFAVLIVIASHFSVIFTGKFGSESFFNIITQNSPFAVDLFFFISGFIMVFTTNGNITNRAIRFYDFAIKRVFRIFPVYYSCLLVYLVFIVMYDRSFQMENIPWMDTLKSSLLIPLNYTDAPPFYGYSLIIPAWTITYEVYFYLVFSISLLITSRFRTILCSLILVLIAFAMQIYTTGKVSFDAQSVGHLDVGVLGNVSFISNPIIYDFIIGMIIGEFFLSDYKNKLSNTIDAIAPILLCFGLSAFISMFRYGYGITNGAIGALFLLFPIIYYDISRGVKYPKPFVFIGNISYSLYISHIVVISVADRYSNLFQVYTQSYGWRRLCVIVTISITVAVLMHKFIEIPTTRLAKRVIIKIKNRNVTS
ncbi:acyltransferase family protein [Enterobacter hormaechei]|uniref:acyltransferase family protein n=1 Tax=Enterobacter hormaechei TaxID=158836 RepID=UPI003F41F670